MTNCEKILIIGAGPAGLSLSTSLALNSEVILVDVDKDKIDLINNKKSPIDERLLNDYFRPKTLILVQPQIMKMAARMLILSSFVFQLT